MGINIVIQSIFFVFLITNAQLSFSCDADPAALAKYVVALVRKDKPLGELEEICIDQLEVFLGGGRYYLSNYHVKLTNI